MSSYQAPQGWIILFDTEDYVYVLDSTDKAAAWLEPATVEELDSVYDSQGNPLEILEEGKSYRLRRTEQTQTVPNLSDRVRQAQARGKLREIDLSHGGLENIGSQLHRKFRIA